MWNKKVTSLSYISTSNTSTITTESTKNSSKTTLSTAEFLYLFSNGVNTQMFNNTPGIQGCMNTDRTTVNTIDSIAFNII